MNVVDLHPEELLDKDARGELSEDERVRLDAHLARCAACQAERVLRADFAEELEGDDRPSAVHGLIQGVLSADSAADSRADGHHPEELLDKEARGELSEDERARLGAHLARCAPCRAERVLRADFAADLAEDGEGDALAALVERALHAAVPRIDLAPATKVREVEPREDRRKPAPLVELASVQGLRRRPRRTAVVLLFAAAVLAASAASATGVTARVWLRLTGGSLDATHTEQESRSSAPAERARGAVSSVVAVPSTVDRVAAVDTASPSPAVDSPSAEPVAPSSAALEASPVVASPASASPLAVAPQTSPIAARGALGAPSPPSAVAPSAIAPAAVAAVSPAGAALAPPPPSASAPLASAPLASAPLAATPAPVAMTASELFDAANAARRAGDTGAALARYESLERQFPASREARLVAATSARLLLDRGDAAGALRRFDAYLAGGSSELREEAMAGRATALERLGQGEDEARAWAALLATYPHTPYAAHARARVGRSSAR